MHLSLVMLLEARRRNRWSGRWSKSSGSWCGGGRGAVGVLEGSRVAGAGIVEEGGVVGTGTRV
jgi:hypothetical protein